MRTFEYGLTFDYAEDRACHNICLSDKNSLLEALEFTRNELLNDKSEDKYYWDIYKHNSFSGMLCFTLENGLLILSIRNNNIFNKQAVKDAYEQVSRACL